MIYLNVTLDRVKVGYSSNVHKRERNYACHDPFFNGFIDVIEGTKQDEKIIHERFFNANDNFVQINNTEWYQCLDDALLNNIKHNKFSFIMESIGKNEPAVEVDAENDFCINNIRQLTKQNVYAEKKKREIKADIIERAKNGKDFTRASLSIAQGQPVIDWLLHKGFVVENWDTRFTGSCSIRICW